MKKADQINEFREQDIFNLLGEYYIDGLSWDSWIEPSSLAGFEDGEQAAEFINGEINEKYVFNQIEHFSHYDTSIEYLLKNDNTLVKSLGIADEMGYNPASLNSCILANLLYVEEQRQQFENDLNEFSFKFNSIMIDEYEEDIQDEDEE